jgi:TIR domain-containing protein
VAYETVFVNYRTGDGEDLAKLVTDRLSAAFGADQVFLDYRSIRPAADYRDALLEGVRNCRVLVPIIGSRWHELMAARDPDWTRLEIVQAYAHGVPVLPLVRDGVRLSGQPGDIDRLAYGQFCRYDPRRAEQDLTALVDAVRTLVPALPAAAAVAPLAGASKYQLTVGRDSHIYEAPVYHVRDLD